VEARAGRRQPNAQPTCRRLAARARTCRPLQPPPNSTQPRHVAELTLGVRGNCRHVTGPGRARPAISRYPRRGRRRRGPVRGPAWRGISRLRYRRGGWTPRFDPPTLQLRDLTSLAGGACPSTTACAAGAGGATRQGGLPCALYLTAFLACARCRLRYSRIHRGFGCRCRIHPSVPLQICACRMRVPLPSAAASYDSSGARAPCRDQMGKKHDIAAAYAVARDTIRRRDSHIPRLGHIRTATHSTCQYTTSSK
jgi:hypothetical protein